MNYRNVAKVYAVMGLVALTAGCGNGSGEQALGTNSRAEVYLESVNIEDLDLIVAEQQGLPTNPGVCSNNEVNFGCTRQFGPATTIIGFTTRSIASTQPYFAYVRNNSGSEQRFLIVVRMDDVEKYRASGTVAVGDTFRVARISRNSASEP